MKVQFTRLARRELMREAILYDRQRTGLGDEFLDEVAHSLVLIKEYPLAAPPQGKKYRRFIMRRFPFSLIYRVDRDTIAIFAVAHHSRRPGYWRNRIKQE